MNGYSETVITLFFYRRNGSTSFLSGIFPTFLSVLTIVLYISKLARRFLCIIASFNNWIF